uniref:RRM domain-containing protein n=1 Tax=Oryza barthii TaxID=65489 RepID=A0A0D3EUF5_9ORYZ
MEAEAETTVAVTTGGEGKIGAFVGAPKNKQTGAARGFAFVQFMDVKLAQPKPSAGGPQLSIVDQKRKIFVGGLPVSATEKKLKEYFNTFGEVNRAIMVTDLNTKMPRGFGFIQFASEESTARALKKDRHFLCGQWVEVSLAMPKQQNAASGTSKLSVQARPFYPTTSSNFATAANYPDVVNIVPVVTPMNCVVSNAFNPHIGFEVPGMILSDGVSNSVGANYSYQNPYLGGGGVQPQGSAVYLQAAHYYSEIMEAEAETSTVTVTTGGEGEEAAEPRQGVPLGTSESELRAHFSQFGTVAFVGAPKNKRFGFGLRLGAYIEHLLVSNFLCLLGPRALKVRRVRMAFLHMDVKLAQPKPSAGGPQLSPGDQKRKIFVDSLSTSLKEYISNFGEVNQAIVVTDLNTKMPRGFSFIQFASEESTARALKKDRHFLCGQ